MLVNKKDNILNIIIIRLSSIGDIFHTFTILPDIRSKYPNANIDWLVDENFKDIAELSPLIDNVISIPLKKWKKDKFSWLSNIIKFKKVTKSKYYDYIIDTQGLIKTAFLAKVLFNGKIYGLNYQSARESLASIFYNYKYNVNQNTIAVIRLRGLINKIFKLDKKLDLIDFKVKSEDNLLNIDGKYVVYLHGTSKENKKWSILNWVELSRWILNNTTLKIVLTYSNQSEYKFTQIFIQQINSQRVILIDKLSFLKLVDLINKSEIIIGVDTGFTHLANLLGKKTLAIYLNSNPGYVGMLESKIAHNFGGIKQSVSVIDIVNYINQQNLLEVNLDV